jgi:dihydrofolate synthase/folylpolyglutamate synthase
MRYVEAVRYLYSLGNEVLTAKLGLNNISTLLRALGDPHQKFRSILIAGTNGKGSVAAFIESVLRSAGIKTGLYTSPHLVQIEERICLCGTMISQEDFSRLTQLVKESVTSLFEFGGPACGRPTLDRHPTYFEMVTAIAFKHFAEQNVDIAVLEVGMGGRFDATNVVDPLVAVITNVDYDHQMYLGNDLGEIASEKAGIIKPRSYQGNDSLPVVCGSDHAGVREIVANRCRTVGARMLQSLDDMEFQAEPDSLGRFRLQVNSPPEQRIVIQIPLPGEHQVSNALTAIQALRAIPSTEVSLEPSCLREGIEAARWPGRLEIIQHEPLVILDGAHNLAGAECVKQYCKRFLQDKPLVLIFGAMRDKPIFEMGAKLFPLSEDIVLTAVASERAADPKTIAELLPEFCARYCFASSTEEALEIARRKVVNNGVILVVGSLFLVGEVQCVLKSVKLVH